MYIYIGVHTLHDTPPFSRISATNSLNNNVICINCVFVVCEYSSVISNSPERP